MSHHNFWFRNGLIKGQIKVDVKHNGTVLVHKNTAVTFEDIDRMKNSGAYFKIFDSNIRRQYRVPEMIAAKLKHLKDDMMRREKEAIAADNNEMMTRGRGQKRKQEARCQ